MRLTLQFAVLTGACIALILCMLPLTASATTADTPVSDMQSIEAVASGTRIAASDIMTPTNEAQADAVPLTTNTMAKNATTADATSFNPMITNATNATTWVQRKAQKVTTFQSYCRPAAISVTGENIATSAVDPRNIQEVKTLTASYARPVAQLAINSSVIFAPARAPMIQRV